MDLPTRTKVQFTFNQEQRGLILLLLIAGAGGGENFKDFYPKR
jgi:hypothetical protein